ncbi:MAG TPA: hypothetical protein VGF45_09795 [Polyangia bacterium]
MYDRTPASAVPKGDSITIESPAIRAVVKSLGRGDFNGEGLEDLVPERAGGARDGTWSTTEAFLLTRQSAAGKLEVIRSLSVMTPATRARR